MDDVTGLRRADGLSRQKGVAVAGAGGFLADDLVEAGDVAGGLQPELVFRAAADGQQPLRALACVCEGLDDMVGAVGDALDQRAVHVATGVGQVQAEERALGVGVVDRGAFAAEIGQEQQVVRAGGAGGGLGGEGGERGFGGQVAGELVAEPVGERAGGGEARHAGMVCRG